MAEKRLDAAQFSGQLRTPLAGPAAGGFQLGLGSARAPPWGPHHLSARAQGSLPWSTRHRVLVRPDHFPEGTAVGLFGPRSGLFALPGCLVWLSGLFSAPTRLAPSHAPPKIR